MTGMKLPNLAGRGERLQADYTYGTKKSSSFNIGIFKPLRGIFRSNLSGAVCLRGSTRTSLVQFYLRFHLNLSGAVLIKVPFESFWCSFI